MFKYFLVFSVAIPLCGHCQTYADSPFYRTASAIPSTAHVEGSSHGSIKANGIVIDLSESVPSSSPDFDEIRGWSVSADVDGNKPAQLFHFYIQYDNLNVTFAYDLLAQPVENTDKIQCTFSAFTDVPANHHRNKDIIPVALPADLNPLVIKSGDAISISTLPLGHEKIVAVHYLRLTRTDLASFTTPVGAVSQTPEDLLRLAQESFKNPSGYEFDGSGLLQLDGSSWQVKFPVVIAAEPAPLETPHAPVFPAGRVGGPYEYAKTGDGSDEKPKRFAIPFSVAGGWERMATNITSVKEVGSERLPLNGEMTACRVLEVQYAPSPNGTEIAPVRYSICSDKHLALKKTTVYSAGRLPTDPVGKWIITFDTAHFHRPAPQWLLDMKTLPATRAHKEWLGKEAPLFHLSDLNGKTVELSALRGKAVLLDFWSTACGPCVREMPNIQMIAKEHKPDLIVWAVSFDQPERDRKWLAQHQQEFPTLSDTEYEVSDLYKVPGIPAAILIDRRGVIRGYWEGEVPIADLEAALKRESREK
jgi:peroxiredoxin